MKTEVTANEESVAITISDERLAALEMYLEQKNIKLSDEIDKCIDGLYQKNVPQNVRDFIDMMSAKKPARKPSELSEDERRLIFAIYFENKTENEVACFLHTTQQNINKKKRRILCKLNKLLKSQ